MTVNLVFAEVHRLAEAQLESEIGMMLLSAENTSREMGLMGNDFGTTRSSL
jgi:hypothetical protein